MKRNSVSRSLAGMVLPGFLALSVPASPQDSLLFLKTAPPPQYVLHPSSPIGIDVSYRYALSSVDSAILHIYVEEYPDGAHGCQGSVHQTDGGNQVLLTRGVGTGSMGITWPGGVHPVYPAGFFAIEARLATRDDSSTIRDFGMYPGVCYHFFPGANGNSGSQPSPPPQPSPPQPPQLFYRWQAASDGRVPPGQLSAGIQACSLTPAAPL